MSELAFGSRTVPLPVLDLAPPPLGRGGWGVLVARAVLVAASARVISWSAWPKSVGGMCPGLAAGSTISSADGA